MIKAKPKCRNLKTKLSVSDRLEKFDKSYDNVLKNRKVLNSKFKEEFKNSSKPSVIKNRININLGKIVRVKFEFPKDYIRTSFEGKLQEVGYLDMSEDRRFEVVTLCSDTIEFYQKNIKRIYMDDREIWIVLKL
ncbi:MAG: hypothetical protein ACH34V_09195 [Flavobacterium sp.]|uniref:hypothetical protein n=1 Tax=Flavobacterium sp. TaxID=239 RepID=UPI003788D681